MARKPVIQPQPEHGQSESERLSGLAKKVLRIPKEQICLEKERPERAKAEGGMI